MTTFTELQQQIAEAEAKVNDLRQKLAEQKNSERAQAIASAKELIKAHGLNAADLGFLGRGAPSKAAAKGAAKPATGDKRGTVAAKYRDSASGKTWTGRGKTPAWMAAELAAGKNKQDFLI
ncbi:MAG: H-NS histone family protein [Burkholderiales bacterium]|nr:MAG: H-NS histone family protein [Burkholderiales bacterium]